MIQPFHIDGFAGGGGASEGYERAFGRRVDVAINHDHEALTMHRANHPLTRHFREDIRALDPIALCNGKRPTSAWFSPDCKDFSKAKGGKPKSKHIRGLAWIVIHWVNTVKPLTIFMENVEEFAFWSPLLADGSRNPWRKGWFFQCFTGALKRRGYVVEWRELRACDYGAPTIRKRFILVARCDGESIAWPEVTHGRADSERVKSGELKPYLRGADCLDFSIPCPSIFLTSKQAKRVRVKRPLVKATLQRVAKGIDRFVLKSAKPFLVSLTHQGGDRIESIEEPFRTITAANRAEKALVSPVLTYGQHGGRSRDASAPMHTITASPKDSNALLAVNLCRQFGTGIGHSANEPHRTIMTQGGGKTQLVTTYLAQNNTGSVGHDARAPISTITGRGTQQSVVGVSLLQYYGQSQPTGIRGPLNTITTHDRFALCEALGAIPPLTPDLERKARRVAKFLRSYGVEFEGEFATVGDYILTDIGIRMLTPRELFRAQGFGDHYQIGDDPTKRFQLTKTSQVRMCGNSVPPPLAAAVLRANLTENIKQEVAA